MRSMIFEKYASVTKPWVVSDSVIGYFDVDKQAARENARKWWDLEGNYVPEGAGPSLDASAFQNWKNYAVLEAGRERVKI
jgi:hypothetical protein